MDDAEQLRAGVSGWNAWRKTHGSVPVLKGQNLTDCLGGEVIGLDLSGMDLSGCLFPKARYQHLNLCGSDLTAAVFTSGSHLESLETNADTLFSGTSFSHCRLTQIEFKTRRFSGVQFHVSALEHVQFPGRTSFSNVNFNRSTWQHTVADTCTWTSCTFSAANFAHCSLEEGEFVAEDGNALTAKNARFAATSLRKSDIKGMDVEGANFIDSDLTAVQGLEFDNNLLQRTLLSPDVDAVWSKLRRRYTGTNMIFTLLALMAFLLPWIFSAGVWLAISNAERSAGAFLQQMEEQQMLPADVVAAYHASGYGKRIKAIQACHAGAWAEGSGGRCLRLALVLTGWHESGLIFTTSLLLLFYNGIRGYLTYRVGTFRDVEAASYRTPVKDSYSHLKVLHQIVTVLAVGAIVSGVSGVFGMLTTLLWLPNP